MQQVGQPKSQTGGNGSKKDIQIMGPSKNN